MRRQDLLEITFKNGMHRRVKKREHAPDPLMSGLIHTMNTSGHRAVDFNPDTQ